MNIENVSRLDSINTLSADDMIHVLRSGFYSTLSYKAAAKEMGDVFQSVLLLKQLHEDINVLMSKLDELSSSTLTKAEANATYASKELFESKKEALLTHSSMDSIVSKYVTEDIKEAKGYELISDSKKLAEEMTDFSGAAMVGISQSNATIQPAETTNG